MAVVSYGASTELDAINTILMSVGESPVNTLDTQSPEVAIAQKTLRQVCREVQAEGWAFNSEIELCSYLTSNLYKSSFYQDQVVFKLTTLTFASNEK